MLLVLQIAGGIVLAWYIITRWNKLTKALGALAAFALGAVAIAGMAWGAIAAGQTVWSNLDTVGYYAFNVFMIVLGLAGVIAMGILLAALFPGLFKANVDGTENNGPMALTIFVFVLHTAFMMLLVGFALPGIDEWSRAQGYKDGGLMFAVLLLSQWLWWPAIKLSAKQGEQV